MANRLFKDMNLDELLVERQVWEKRVKQATTWPDLISAQQFRDACTDWIERRKHQAARVCQDRMAEAV